MEDTTWVGLDQESEVKTGSLQSSSYSSSFPQCSEESSESWVAFSQDSSRSSSSSLQRPFTSVVPPSGAPGRYLDGTNYAKKLRKAVSRKWHTAEEKEWWYPKYRAALRKKVERLHARQKGLCYFCLSPTFLNMNEKGELSNKRFATADHVIPSSKGGTDHLSNLVMACQACNSLRGDMRFNKFVELRSTPERWSQHCREIQRRNEPKKLKRKAKSEEKALVLVWKIGLLLYLRPEWAPKVEEIRVEFARREGIIRSRHEKRVRNSLIDSTDLL